MKKTVIALSIVGLLAAGTTTSVWAGQDVGVSAERAVATRMSVDTTFYDHTDALFNYLEQLLPQYFPGHPQNQYLPDNGGDGPVVYRVYASGNVLATWWYHFTDMDFYYMPSGGNWSYLGSLDNANQVICGGQCWGSPNTASDAEVRLYLDAVLGQSGTTLSGGLTEQLTPILSAVMGKPTGTCPTVTTNFTLAGATDLNALLQSLPKPTLATVDYGSGCTSTTGDRVSGQVELRLDNLAIDATTQKIDVSFGLTANSLAKNGQVVADGSMAGNFSVSLGSATTGSGSIQLTNFLLSGDARMSGKIDIGILSSSSYTVNLALSNSKNVQTQLALSINTASDGSQVISTTTPGSVNQYTVSLNAITYNDKVCKGYPIAGSAVFSASGNTWTATFDSSCNGTYTLR